MSQYPNSKKCLRAILRLGLVVVTFLITINTSYSQYFVDFEGSGETKPAYASATVSLSGINWDMTEALIGILADDFKNGARSARMRGYGTSSITMLENKAYGIGIISFQYRRYGTDIQVDWKVEYSTDNGSNWNQIGSDFTAPASDVVQTFSETVNVGGDIRIRIKRATETGSANRRLNIDDITITDYTCNTQITTFSPTTGPVGTVVTIEGNNISLATDLTFAGVSASFTVIDNNTIEAKVPPNATSGKIRVFSECWGTSASNFTVISYTGICGSDGATHINENIQSWTSQTSYGNYTQTIAAGDVDLFNCMVYPAGTGTGCSNGFIQVRKGDGIVELPPLNTVGTITFSINAFAANRSVYLQQYISGAWENLTLFADISTTCADYTYQVNSASSSVRIRIANASDPIKIHNITVNAFIAPTLQITGHPSDQKVCNGANASFTVNASGATGYQWYWLNSGTWEVLSAETAATLTLNGVDLSMHGFQYYCRVTDGTCTYFSNAAQLTVIPSATLSVVGNSVICNEEIAQLRVGYLRVESTFTISIRLDGTEEKSYNQADVPAGNPFIYTTEPLVWEGSADTKERYYSVIVSSDGCSSDEVQVTLEVVKTLTPTITPLP